MFNFAALLSLFLLKEAKNVIEEKPKSTDIEWDHLSVVNQVWSIRHITKKLKNPHQPSINSPEFTNKNGARWSLSFFPYDRRIDNEEYTSFRFNLFSCPERFYTPSNVTVELSLIYYSGNYMRRKTFRQQIRIKNLDDMTQVIFRYPTKNLKRQLRRIPYEDVREDMLTVALVVYFGDIPDSYYD